MSVIFVLITFSLIVALIFLGFFIWAVRSGQYEDKYTPSVRMLFDDAAPVDASKADRATPEAATPDTEVRNAADAATADAEVRNAADAARGKTPRHPK